MAYQFCSGGSYCYSSTTTSVLSITGDCVTRAQNSQFSINGTRVYNNNYINESLTAQVNTDLGYSGFESLITQNYQWSNTNFTVLFGPLNRNAIWFDAGCDSNKDLISDDITVSFAYTNTGITNQFYFGFGAWTGNDAITGGSFNLTINGESVVSGGTNSMYSTYWHIIPIVLLSCDNLINFTVTPTQSSQDGFGFAIYNNSYSEIISATSDSDLDILFDTNSLITRGKLGDFVNASCPVGYMVSGDTLTATCVNMIYSGCSCTCCDRYEISRIGGLSNLAYYDCDNNTKIISDLISGTRRICACSIITPTVTTTTGWVTENGEFNIVLIRECDSSCIDIPDGPPPPPEPEPICADCGFTMMSVGIDHTLGISGGTLFAWGDNTFGQLGLGVTGGQYNTPQIVNSIDTWIYVEASSQATFAINSVGELWVCGNSGTVGSGDQFGLGNGSPTTYNTLSQVVSPSPTGWDKLQSSYTSTIALRTDNTIWGTGYNEQYQLGLGDNVDRASFEQIGTDTDWDLIARGPFHTLGLKTDGTIYSWGTNLSGNNLSNPLGLGGASIYQQVTSPSAITVSVFPSYPSTILFTSISTGNYHSVALSTDGSIWGWGRQIEGQLDCENCGAIDNSKPFPMDGRVSPDGVTSEGGGIFTNSGFTFISAAGNMTLAITSGLTIGNFFPFTDANGINWNGQFSGTRIWSWGQGYGGTVKTLLQDDGNRLSLETKSNWCTVWFGGTDGTSNSVFFAKDLNGTIYTWGDNQYGQLGIGPTPACVVCDVNNDIVNPIGVCFNNCDEACPCVCVGYTIVNNSTNDATYQYTECSGNVVVATIPRGGFGQNAQTISFCACSDSASLISGNLNLVNISLGVCT